jgi:hypothetical protein
MSDDVIPFRRPLEIEAERECSPEVYKLASETAARLTLAVNSLIRLYRTLGLHVEADIEDEGPSA